MQALHRELAVTERRSHPVDDRGRGTDTRLNEIEWTMLEFTVLRSVSHEGAHGSRSSDAAPLDASNGTEACS